MYHLQQHRLQKGEIRPWEENAGEPTTWRYKPQPPKNQRPASDKGRQKLKGPQKPSS
jgi:hypothetical protein